MGVEKIARLTCDFKGCKASIEVEAYPGTEGDYGYDGYDEKWIERPCVDYDWPVTEGWSGSQYDVRCPKHGEEK